MLRNVRASYQFNFSKLEAKTRAAILDIAKDLHIDPFRIFKTGFSFGGQNTPARLLHGDTDNFRTDGYSVYQDMLAAGCTVEYMTYTGGQINAKLSESSSGQNAAFKIHLADSNTIIIDIADPGITAFDFYLNDNKSSFGNIHCRRRY